MWNAPQSVKSVLDKTSLEASYEWGVSLWRMLSALSSYVPMSLLQPVLACSRDTHVKAEPHAIPILGWSTQQVLLKFHSGQRARGMLQRHSIYKTLQWLKLRPCLLQHISWETGQAAIVSYVVLPSMGSVLLHTSYLPWWLLAAPTNTISLVSGVLVV